MPSKLIRLFAINKDFKVMTFIYNNCKYLTKLEASKLSMLSETYVQNNCNH